MTTVGPNPGDNVFGSDAKDIPAEDGFRDDGKRKQIEDGLRDHIGKLMSQGLETQVEPFPETTKEFDDILSVIRAIPFEKLEERLIVSGFINHPVEDQSCENCIYYLAHRKYCDLPELALPVEPHWWCRLWRI